MKIPLLRRNKGTHSSQPASKFCCESSKSNDLFLPFTVTPNTYDKGQKLQLLRHAKQTLEYIDLSTSSTIIQINQIVVQALKNELNSQHLLDFISCLDHGLWTHYFNKEKWSEDSLTKALEALKKDRNLKQLWSDMLTKMHVTYIDNDLSCDLLFIFVTKFTKRRCVTYLAIDGFGPSAQDNSAIRQLLKKYDLLNGKKGEAVRDSIDKSKCRCHGCGELGHWVKDCPKGYNKDWLMKQQCFKCQQLGHFRKDCPFKLSGKKSTSPSTSYAKKSNESAKRTWYLPTTALPKMIGVLDSYDINSSQHYLPLIADNSDPQKTKQQSEQWFNFRQGKINGSKAAVCLGWLGKTLMESCWSQLRLREHDTNSDIADKHEQAMKWGCMCEKSAMATYISKFLSRNYPNSKGSESGVHIINDENGIPWLGSSPDGLVNIQTGTDGLGVVEIKRPFMGGKPIPYKTVCVNHIPQLMLEMYCTNTKWCHYVVWTPVGYHIYLVKRDDKYIADLLTYLKDFWDSANDQDGTMPHWQADPFNLKERAKDISRKCRRLSSGNSVRDNDILKHQFLDLFWSHEKEKTKPQNNTKPVPVRKCGGCKTEEWKCKLNPCEIRLERLKKRNAMVTKHNSYQSYIWGSGGLGNSCHQDTILEFLYHPFRRQIQITSDSGQGMNVLEECFQLREEGNFLESKLRLWKWLRDETDNGHIYYSLGRSASMIGIFFRLFENSEKSFTLNFRITKQIATICSLQPQIHIHKRTKHHVIFPLTDGDTLQQHTSTDHRYKINLVVESLLTRTNHLLPSSYCASVISETDIQEPNLSLSEITPKTTEFCSGKNIVTSQVTSTPKFFFVMRNVSSTYTPILEGLIDIGNINNKLMGIVYFNWMHFWCEVYSTQIGYRQGWYFYDGMIKGVKAEYIGETLSCKQPQNVHILLYEQCVTDAHVYGGTPSMKRKNSLQ